MSGLNKRYSFLQVFWVVLAINLFFTLLGIFVIVVLEVTDKKDALNELYSLSAVAKQLFGIFCQTAFFYFSLNYYNRLMVEKKGSRDYLLYTGFLFVVILSYLLLMQYFFPSKSSSPNASKKGVILFSFIFSSLFFTGASLLIAYLNNLRDEKKQRKILEAQKMQLEVDKSQANFKFLKSQINPHFLHNTLNFLYAKSLPYSAELSEGILTLSDIMRYALNEATGADDKAALKDEIEHVRNVIRINQLRFSNNLYVNFEVHGIVNGAEIVPFVLITMVENAFKHGDLQKSEHPITIRLEIENKHFYFYCHNKKKSGPKEISTGLGLDNIRNRLDFAYGKNYKLAIKEDADFYTTELTIDTL